MNCCEICGWNGRPSNWPPLAAPAEAHLETPKASAGVARIRKAANDNKPARSLLAWPAFERLAHRQDGKRLFALIRWRDLNFPHEIVIADDETGDEEANLDAKIRINPSEGSLLEAVGWKVIDRERWAFTGKMMNVYMKAPDAIPVFRTIRKDLVEAKLGDLIFRNGELVQWGATKKGVALRPVERTGDPKGVSEPDRSDNKIWSYLKLTGAVSPLKAQPYCKPFSREQAIGDCYNPLPREAPNTKDKHGRYGVREARQLLSQLGIDGSVAFEDLLFSATRCADALAPGSDWFGGVKQPKPTASKPAGREPVVARHVETLDYVEHLRGLLGKHVKVLDMAITDASASDIGKATGLGQAYAEKRGPALIDAALDALIEIDETSRGDFKESADDERKIAA